MEVRFGVLLPLSAAEGPDPVAAARDAEELGFDLVTAWDHLHGSEPSFETWTLLSWVAASTTRIHVGATVLGLPYRPPAVLAKMAESLDRLSNGRLVLGLGAGGREERFRALGLAVRSPREKLEALAEAVAIIRGLWTEETLTHSGRHFRTEGARIEPKPQRRIPIWLGTYAPKALALTGRVADGWIPSLPYAPPDEAIRMRQRVRRAAAETGRDPDEVVCAYNVPVRVGDREESGGPIVAGSPNVVADRLAELVRAGFTYLIFWPRGDPAEQRERLAREVLPAVRSAVS